MPLRSVPPISVPQDEKSQVVGTDLRRHRKSVARSQCHPPEILKEIKYIHQNPVKRGLVTRPRDWAWSSARWYLEDRTSVVPVDPLPEWLEWMRPRIVDDLNVPQA